MKIKICFYLFLLFIVDVSTAQYAPAAGLPGSTAIYKDSTCFVAWASGCIVHRGFQQIDSIVAGLASAGDSSMALGKSGDNPVVSLGDGGSAILTFDKPIKNGPGWDFAIFENGFNDDFLELAFVEVSSNGTDFFRFPSVSLTDTAIQVDTYGTLDPTKINNLAGKYRLFNGVPFDLEELSGTAGLDVMNITHIKVIDVIGSINPFYASYDSQEHKINDPWPTPFPVGGFDLDAVGVINQQTSGIETSENNCDTKMYPNPCQNYLRIELPEASTNNIEVTAVTGKGILRLHNIGTHATIDFTDIPRGIYIVKISNEHSLTFKKIIKN
jgi:hypothetical protein